MVVLLYVGDLLISVAQGDSGEGGGGQGPRGTHTRVHVMTYTNTHRPCSRTHIHIYTHKNALTHILTHNTCFARALVCVCVTSPLCACFYVCVYECINVCDCEGSSLKIKQANDLLTLVLCKWCPLHKLCFFTSFKSLQLCILIYLFCYCAVLL